MKFLLHFAYSIVNVHVNHSLWNQDEATEPMFYVSHLNKERRVPRCVLVGEEAVQVSTNRRTTRPAIVKLLSTPLCFSWPEGEWCTAERPRL